MLKPTLKALGVTNSERNLDRLLNNTFFSLWSYMGPCNDKKLEKNKQGKEICDAIIVFENKVVIISDKENAFKQPINAGDLKTIWARWYDSSVKKSILQLVGAEKWIKDNPNKVFLDKKCLIRFPFDFSRGDLEFHLIALTKNTEKLAQQYFDSFKNGSTGSFIHYYSLGEEQVIKIPFTLCDANKNKTFVHIFDESSFKLIVRELGTISDFLNYLKVKETLIRDQNLAFINGEEDLLGYYLDNEKQLKSKNLPYYFKLEETDITIQEGYWKNFINTKKYLNHQEIIKSGWLWNNLITKLSDSIVSAVVGEGKDLSFDMHERAMRFMASENKISRQNLSDALDKQLQVTPLNGQS